MANFFSSVEHLGRQSITQPFKSVGEVFQGHPGKGFQDLFHSASGASQDVAHSLGIRGWVGDHPMQSVGALAATIFGGWAAAGAAGAGAAGTAGASAAGTGGASAASAASASGLASATGAGGASSIGGAGVSAYLAPASQGGIAATSGTVSGANALSFGGSAMSYTPSAALQAGTQASAHAAISAPTTGLASSFTASGAPEAGTGFAHTAATAPEAGKLGAWGTMKQNWGNMSSQDKMGFANNMLQGISKSMSQGQSQAPQASAPAPQVGSGKMDMSAFKEPTEPQGLPQMYQMPAYQNMLGGA